MKDKVKLVIKIVVLVLIIAWMSLVIMDYFRAKGGDNPRFCISEEYHVYNDKGDLIKDLSTKEFEALSDSEKSNLLYTYQCTGLGYKFFRYNREFKAIEFGPFFTKERLNVNN